VKQGAGSCFIKGKMIFGQILIKNFADEDAKKWLKPT
jgi:hypothetical protein